MLTIRISIPVLTLVQRGTVFLLVFFFLNHTYSSSILCYLTMLTSFCTSLLCLQVWTNNRASEGTAGRQRHQKQVTV